MFRSALLDVSWWQFLEDAWWNAWCDIWEMISEAMRPMRIANADNFVHPDAHVDFGGGDG
jgi:hypothetical protein